MIQYYKSKYIIFDGKVFENNVLAVKDEKIFDIIKEGEVPETAAIIDYGNAVITPGFVNLHTHLQYTDLKPVFTTNSQGHCSQSETIQNPNKIEFSDWLINLIQQYYLWAEEKKIKSFKNGLREAVLSGCTCIVQLSGEDFIPEILNKLELKSFIFLETFSNTEESSLKEIKKLKEKIKKIKQESNENLTVGISPHSIYNVHKILWEEIAKFASAEDILVHTHLAESPDEINWCSGKSSFIDKIHKFIGWDSLNPYEKDLNPVDYLEKMGVLNALKENLTAAHCIQLDEKSLEKLVNSGAKIAHCPRSNILLHGKTLNLQQLPEFILENTGLGTDSRFSNYDLSILNEAKYLSLGRLLKKGDDYHPGLDFQKIINMLTINSARILKIDNKDADFLVFKLQNHENYQEILNKERPDDIYIKGKQIVKDGKFISAGWEFLNEPE